MTLKKWIISKGVWYGLAVAAFYAVGQFFGIIPQPIKDMISWFNVNTVLFVVGVCFIVACWTVIKVSGHRKRREE
jgi:heme/copper-type cytochrome/quinol oxidase subunit 2